MDAELEPAFRRNQSLDNRIKFVYHTLRLLCAIGTLFTALCKIPLIVAAVQLALFVVKNRSHNGSTEYKSNEENQAKLGIELKINVLFLGIIYCLHVIIPIITCTLIVFNKPRCYWPYFTVTGVWLLFVIIAFFVDEWPLPLGLAIIILQHLIRGFWIFESPSHWQFITLRISIIIDIITVPLLIALLTMQCKYGLAKECRLFKKRYSLVSKI